MITRPNNELHFIYDGELDARIDKKTGRLARF